MTSVRIACGPIELRLPTPGDAAALFDIAREPAVSRYLEWPVHRTVDDSHTYIADAARLWARRVAFLPCIYRVADGQLLGAVGISHLDRGNRRGEVGTWLGKAYQGRGYNLPAKAAIFRVGFDLLGLHRLELAVGVDNARSLRSIRTLPAVAHEGRAALRLWRDGTGVDAEVFAITTRDWDPCAYPAVELGGGLP